MRALPVLDQAPEAPPPPRWPAARYLADVKNVLQAQVALRYKRVYLPSLFAHYSVNSVCNLRCSYCYVSQPQIVPAGFTLRGLPLERAKRVLRTLREECIALRLLGGEPLLYREIPELVRYARRELRYWHVSIITNGLALERRRDDWDELFEDLDLLTLSIDRTRLAEYPDEMRRLTAYLPELLKLARARRVAMTLNYTATWEELAEPQLVRDAVAPYRPYFSSVYVVPVREAGKTPLPLLRAALALNGELSWMRSYAGDRVPEENVAWYVENCDPKLKIKVDPQGGLVYPCENHSFSAGSLESHTIRELWGAQLSHYPNESCVGCGKQRFRSHAVKQPLRSLALGWGSRKARPHD